MRLTDNLMLSWLDLLWYLRYTTRITCSLEAKSCHKHPGKAVIAMCYSAYFIQATRETFVQRQLLQCRTCGSQAFHVLDCCRNPDYARVPTSPLGERLKAWLEAVPARMRASLFWTLRRPAEPASPAALDAWEARPLTLSNAEDTRVLRETGADKAVEEIEHETLSAHR
jgi:hypothetical protein